MRTVLGLVALTMLWGVGCRRESTVLLEEHAGMGRVESRLIIHPKGVFGGETLDWKVLPQDELERLLAREMPAAEALGQGASVWDALEAVSGKKVVWVPELGEHRWAAGQSYVEWLGRRGRLGAGSRPTFGEMLSALLTSMTEVGFHLPGEGMLERDYMNVAAVTGRHIVIMAVPVE